MRAIGEGTQNFEQNHVTRTMSDLINILTEIPALGECTRSAMIRRDDRRPGLEAVGTTSGKRSEGNLSGDGLMLGLPDMAENSSR
ncbi:hypothetical protein TNCV_2469391 [Trichonephila clavipes]|nr:hypothetical protein TNCV_2469391 [Trichonephila clavipes]